MFDLTETHVEKFLDEKNIKNLLKSLNYKKDSSVRYKAAEALGEIGDKSTVPHLIKALKDNDEDVVEMLIYSLGEIGDKRAAKPIIQVLNDFEEGFKETCLFSLGEMGGSLAQEQLILALKDEKSDIRWRASEALGKIGNPKAVPAIIAVMSDESSDVRYHSSNALGEIGDERAVESLIKSSMYDKSWRVRRCSLNSLGRIDESPIDPFIEALNDADCHVREKAVVIIGKTGDEEALNYLEKVLDDEDPDVRERAANVLKDSEHDTNESAEKGLKTVKIVSDTEKTAQHRLEEVIERIGNDEAIDVLVEALEHENPEIRHRSAEILGDIGDERAVKPLINALKDKKSSVQWRAGEAIKKLGTPSVIYLIDALDDEDENVRSRSAWALGEIRDKRAVKPLMEKLKDKNASVRWKTAIALSKFGKESFDYLLDALKYENVMVREKAAEALGEMGDPAALDALENALLDKDIYVRRSAEDAIKIIKSKN